MIKDNLTFRKLSIINLHYAKESLNGSRYKEVLEYCYESACYCVKDFYYTIFNDKDVLPDDCDMLQVCYNVNRKTKEINIDTFSNIEKLLFEYRNNNVSYSIANECLDMTKIFIDVLVIRDNIMDLDYKNMLTKKGI